ncbi:MAG: hypothetical protein ACR2F1_15635 [Nitrososphaeraceae archaeon]
MSHTHQLQYYLLTDGAGNYLGNVSQLPPVMVQGTSINEIESEIINHTSDYLRNFPTEHARITRDQSPKLNDSDFKNGEIVEKKFFTVECDD